MNIHSDFKRLTYFKLDMRRWSLLLIRCLIWFDHKRAKWDANVRVRHHKVAGSAGGILEVMEITPVDIPDSSPALIYHHGGILVFSYWAMHIHNIAQYAIDSGCRIFMLTYPLLSKPAPYPESVRNGYQVLRWVRDRAAALGVNAERIAVGGDGYGGMLAALMAQLDRDKKRPPLCGQMLIYPALDHQCQSESARELDATPIIRSAVNRTIWKVYLRFVGLHKEPHYISPMQHENLRDLPPTYIETAEFDPLRDEGVAYAQALSAAGVEVELNATKGTVPAYDIVTDSAISIASMRRRIDALKGFFA